MTRKEFETTDEALVMIVSLNPATGETMHDTYDWRTCEGYLKDFERDFPKHLHFFKYNKAALDARRKTVFGDYTPRGGWDRDKKESL